HTIKVQYGGDSNYSGSTGFLNNITSNNFTVNAAQTSTSLVSSANPSSLGSAVTFTATVTATPPGRGTPNGTGAFNVDGVNQSPAVNLDASGHATLTLSNLSFGSHNIYAVYNPPATGANYSTSTSPTLAQKVNFATNTAIGSAPNPSVLGQAVTFTAT